MNSELQTSVKPNFRNKHFLLMNTDRAAFVLPHFQKKRIQPKNHASHSLIPSQENDQLKNSLTKANLFLDKSLFVGFENIIDSGQEKLKKLISTYSNSVGSKVFIKNLHGTFNFAVEEIIKSNGRFKSFCKNILIVISEEVYFTSDQLFFYFQDPRRIESHSFDSLAELVFKEDYAFLCTFQKTLKYKKHFSNSENIRSIARYFYEKHKPRVLMFFSMYIMRKFSEILMLFNLHEEALVYLNYLKGLFAGDNYQKEFVKIYILFGDCLLATNRLDFCLRYFRRALYLCWKVDDQKHEILIYERIAQYFYRREDFKMSAFYQDRFSRGQIEPKSSKYRQIGIEKLKNYQERIRLKNFGFGIFSQNETSALKGYAHKINLSFENNEEDEDIIVSSTDSCLPSFERSRVNLESLYKSKLNKQVVCNTHKAVTRSVKNFLIRNLIVSRKRILQDNSLANFKGPYNSTDSIHRKFNQIVKITNYFHGFLTNSQKNNYITIN